MDRSGIGSLDEFDDRFGGAQCVFNWVQELEMEPSTSDAGTGRAGHRAPFAGLPAVSSAEP